MGERTYKQLNWTSRIKLETMLKHGHSKKEIAEELGVHISTVYRELKRGTYEHLNSDYTTEERYSPEKAEARYQEGLAAKGAPLKIGKNHAAAQFIEDKIGNEDYSPAAVCALLKQEKYKHFGITFCRATIYKYVEDGVFLTLTNADLPEKGERKKKHKTIKKKQSRASSGTSIEEAGVCERPGGAGTLGNGYRRREETDESPPPRPLRARYAAGNHYPH